MTAEKTVMLTEMSLGHYLGSRSEINHTVIFNKGCTVTKCILLIIL